MTLTEAQTQFNALADRLIAAKAAQKAALASLGRTPTDVWDTYPDELRAVTGGTGNYQESKTVTADPAGMTILPDEGYSGMLKAIIAAEPNFQPWNLVDGIEAWGITGTARPYVKPGGTDWPDVPATEEEMDEAVQEDDADAPIEDKMVLVDNEGNITTGYLYTDPDSGLMVYNGRVYPGIASVHTDEVKDEYPYAYICYHMAWWRLILSDTQLCAAHTDLGWNYLNSNGAEVNYQVYDWKNDFDSGWEYVGEYTNALNSSFKILWSNADVYSVEGALFMAGSAPIEYDGFTITAYDPTTTEFRAVGWRRVSKHTTGELAGQITKDNFTRQESGGWNYLKNIRSCTREKLYYKGVEVWPDNEYPANAGAVYGVEWDCTSTATKLTRTDGAAAFADPTPATTLTEEGSSPFDSLMPWAGMKKYNVIDNEIVYSEDDTGFSMTDYDTVVYIPSFYYRVEKDTTNGTMKWQISPGAQEGFAKHPGSGRYIGRYHTTKNNSVYSSRSGLSPVVSITHATARDKSHAKGDAWWMLDLATWSALQILCLVEYADWDSQAVLGGGQNSGSVKSSGGTDGAAYHTLKRSSASNQYRWVEDPWSNVRDWVDGFVASSRACYVGTDNSAFGDTTSGLTATGITLPSGGFISALGLSDEASWAFLPSAAAGADGSYVPDYVYSFSGVRVLYVGGDYGASAYYGLFCFSANGGASDSASYIGSRLLYAP